MPVNLFDVDMSAVPTPARGVRRKLDEAGASASGSADAAGKLPASTFGKKQADNLDFRQRQSEALIYNVYQVEKAKAESTTPLKQLVLAKQHWDSKLPSDGTAHEWGHQKITLAVSFLRAVCEGETTKEIEVMLQANEAAIREEDNYARALLKPTISVQLDTLRSWTSKKPSTEAVTDWIQHMQITPTKKGGHYLIRWNLKPNHVLASLDPLFRQIIRCAGGTELDGPAPRGPLYHKKGNKKK